MSQKLPLRNEQKAAVDHDSGHLLIIACPGSGKTEVVSRRVAELIKKGEDPEKIVSFTFTEKAANELKARIRKILQDECSNRADFGDMYVGTIHGYCAKLLRDIDPRYRSFDVLDDSMRIAYLNKYDIYYERVGLEELQRLHEMSRYHLIDKFLKSADIVMTEDVDFSNMSSTKENNLFRDCYVRYRKALDEDKYFDFSSIIKTLVEVLLKDPAKLKKVRDLVQHVTVDEYQDVNRMQEMLVEILSEGAKSVCAVGDDDQNIYNWRGSNVGIIRNFKKKYSKNYNVTEIHLDVNYRSTPQIISTCRGFIEHNNDRLPKEMKPNSSLQRQYEDGDIICNHFDTEDQEFDFIAKKIRELDGTEFVDKKNVPHSLSLGNIAVLVRTNDDASRLVRFLERNGIESVAYGGRSVFEREEVRLAMDCISYVFSCRGYTVEGIPSIDDLKTRYVQVFKSRFPSADVSDFVAKMNVIKNNADQKLAQSPRDYLGGLGLQEYYHNILNALGAENFDFGRVYNYNLAVLSDAISDYELVYIRLRASQVIGFVYFALSFVNAHYSETIHSDPTIQNVVNVLTIHKAKGLEFPVVFLPCFVNRGGHRRNDTFVDENLYDSEMYLGDDEDDRRMYYTAMTRSEKYLYITGSTSRGPGVRRKTPNKFIAEIPDTYFSKKFHSKRQKSSLSPLLLEDATYPTSFSQLNSYDRCPKDFQLRHIYGYNAGVPPGFGYGTNIHNMLNMIFKGYIERKHIPSEGEITKMFDEIFKLRYATKVMSDNMRKKAEQIIKRYVQLNRQDFNRVLTTEKNFEFVMGKAMIAGQIDLLMKVDDKRNVTDVEIIDFKSEQKTDGEYQADHEKQLRYYAIACMDSLGMHPESAWVHHLSEDDPAKSRSKVDISQPLLEKTKSGIAEQIANVLSQKFDAKPRKKEETCKECDYKSICPMKTFHSGLTLPSVGKTMVKVAPSVTRGGTSGKKTLSAKTIEKSEALVKSGGVIKIDDNTFKVKSSSTKGRMYDVKGETCTCRGFADYYKQHTGEATCSHIEAVKSYKKQMGLK